MAKKRRVHPLVSAAALAPLAIGLLTPQSKSHKTPHTAATAPAHAIKLACTLPFDSIEQHHPIDDTCGVDGKATKEPQMKQNEAKNNFCARGTPIDIDFDVLHQLQKEAEDKGISFGSDGAIPEDRSQLKHLSTKVGVIGEGMVVRLAAFVVDAHYSNLGKGESVNCGHGGKENNDIHIVLGEKSNKKGDECSSVTAEMSPHFRPDVWSPEILNDHNEHLYRFTGQLFFDASHKPCAHGTGSPKRSSIWEVHPVYAVDMCVDPGNNCQVDSDVNWVTLPDAVNGDSSETRLWLPDEISQNFGRGARRPRLP